MRSPPDWSREWWRKVSETFCVLRVAEARKTSGRDEQLLTDDMLDDDLDGPERHIPQRDLRVGPPPPFDRRELLQEPFNGLEERDGVEQVLAKILLHAARPLTDALEDELCVLGRAGGRLGRRVEGDRDVLEEAEERTEEEKEGLLRQAEGDSNLESGQRTNLKTGSRLPSLKMRRRIMLMNLESSLTPNRTV